MSTFVVSAFWHGFYPSYYIMFVLAAILNEINKDVYRSWALMHYYIKSAKVRYLLGHVGNFLPMSYFGILFQALTVERTLWFLGTTYYYMPISLVVTLGLLRHFRVV